MKQLTRDKILYWLNALEEDCKNAKCALLSIRKPDKHLERLVVPFKDSVKNLVGVIETEI